MLQKDGGGQAWKKGGRDPTNYFSRREGGEGGLVRSDFTPVCATRRAFFCLPLVDLPPGVVRRPCDAATKESRLTSRDKRFRLSRTFF